MMDEKMRDGAFPGGMNGYRRAVAGYYGGPEAYHVWAPGDWDAFRGVRKLPIWVAGNDGVGEAHSAIEELWALGVPKGVYTAVDFETRVDATYLNAFGRRLNAAGYKVWVYGSASTVFSNPQLQGYWVADYAGIGPFMYRYPGRLIRATQYTDGPAFDSSTVKAYTYYRGSWWK